MTASLDNGTRLAIQRTQLAAERTLMAWIRTAFSMISFGFTIGKFLEYLSNKELAGGVPPHGGLLPKLLVLLGLASLFVGVIEYRHSMKALGVQISQQYRSSPVGIIAVIVGLLGALAFVGLIFRVDFL